MLKDHLVLFIVQNLERIDRKWINKLIQLHSAVEYNMMVELKNMDDPRNLYFV